MLIAVVCMSTCLILFYVILLISSQLAGPSHARIVSRSAVCVVVSPLIRDSSNARPPTDLHLPDTPKAEVLQGGALSFESDHPCAPG